MDVALNIGAQLGGVAVKETNGEVGAIVLGRQNEGYEDGPKRDGEAKDFLAAISKQAATTKGEAKEETSISVDPDARSLKLQFRNLTALTIDDAESKSDEPQFKSSALLTVDEVEGAQLELEDEVSEPSVINATGDKQGAVQSNASLPLGTSDAKSDFGEPQPRASTLITGDDTDIVLTRPQSGAPAPLVIDGAESELDGRQFRSSAPLLTEDENSVLREPQSRVLTFVAGDDGNVALAKPQSEAFAPLEIDGAENKLDGRASRSSAPIATDGVETELDAQQSRVVAPLVNDDAESGLPVIASNGQPERPQNVELVSIRPAGTDDRVKPRRPVLLGAKTVIAHNTETPSPLVTNLGNSLPAVLGGQPQLVSPGTEQVVSEDSPIAEKQTQQPATLRDSSPTILLRQAPQYSLTSAGDTVAQVLTANNGEVVSSDLDLDMAVDLASGRRLVGQAGSIPQAVTSPNATQAPVVGATAQIIAAIKANRRSDTIEIRLDPPELGRVKIDFTMETMDSVKAILSAERGETLDHMRRNIGELAAQLKDAGFKSMEFEFAKNGEREFSKGSNTLETPDKDGAGLPSLGQGEIVYLSMRSDAQLDLLA
jgi:flagellar hook-length control protein FliK